MAYTDPLDVTTPPDSESLSQGDDRIREFKRAIKQRLESVFEDVDAEPMKFKSGVANNVLKGTLTLSSSDATIAAAHYKEFDVTVTGAKPGAFVFAEWAVKTSATAYPTVAASPPNTGGGVVLSQDLVTFGAWCVEADKVRVRMTVAGATGITVGVSLDINAWAIQSV